MFVCLCTCGCIHLYTHTHINPHAKIHAGRKVAAVERRQRRAAVLVHSLPPSGDPHPPTQVHVPTRLALRAEKKMARPHMLRTRADGVLTRCCDAKCVLCVLTRCAHEHRDLKWATYTVPLCWDLRGIWSQHNKVSDVAMSDVSFLVDLLPIN